MPISLGTPQYGSLRFLARRPPGLPGERTYFYLRNSNHVVMLADRLGTACLAVFCVDGYLVITGDYPTAESQAL